MFFTQEDYKKIQKWLLLNSVKDTEFNEATSPFKGDESIAFVQNGINVKAPLKELVEQFLLLGVSDFLNVTTKFNEHYITLNQAINIIPFLSRKIGQVITFLDTEGNWQIYQFKGTRKNQWNNITLWENVISTLLDSKLEADEEDITTKKRGDKYQLKFKDKEYNKEEFSGLGKVILRKNVSKVMDPTEGKPMFKNLLTQPMFKSENTIYVIRYDYSLNGGAISLPKNSTLEFDGGSIIDGKIEGRNTRIINSTSNSFINIETTGTWNTELSEPIEGEIKTINVVRDIIANQDSITNIENNIDNIEEDIKDIDKDLSGLHEDFNNIPKVDEEGITVGEDNLIRFKDKEYSPEEFSGLGRVYLRKNIVDGKNILTLEMVGKPNTRYIILYDYNLNKLELNIDDTSILEFLGGTLSNGTINGTFSIDSPKVKIFENIIVTNYIGIKKEWFGFKSKTVNDYDLNLIPNSKENAKHNFTVLKYVIENLNININFNDIYYIDAEKNSIELDYDLKLFGGTLLISNCSSLFLPKKGMALNVEKVKIQSYGVTNNANAIISNNTLDFILGDIIFESCVFNNIRLFRLEFKEQPVGIEDFGNNKIIINNCHIDTDYTFAIIISGLFHSPVNYTNNTIVNLVLPSLYIGNRKEEDNTLNRIKKSHPIYIINNSFIGKVTADAYYLCSVLISTNTVYFKNNLIDNIINTGTGTCYDAYLSCINVFYENNTINNMMSFPLNGKEKAQCEIFKSKGYEISELLNNNNAGVRYFSNNSYTVDSNYLQSLGADPKDIYYNIFNYTQPMRNVVFKNNSLKYIGEGYINFMGSTTAMGNTMFDGNYIKATAINSIGSLIRARGGNTNIDVVNNTFDFETPSYISLFLQREPTNNDDFEDKDKQLNRINLSNNTFVNSTILEKTANSRYLYIKNNSFICDNYAMNNHISVGSFIDVFSDYNMYCDVSMFFPINNDIIKGDVDRCFIRNNRINFNKGKLEYNLFPTISCTNFYVYLQSYYNNNTNCKYVIDINIVNDKQSSTLFTYYVTSTQDKLIIEDINVDDGEESKITEIETNINDDSNNYYLIRNELYDFYIAIKKELSNNTITLHSGKSPNINSNYSEKVSKITPSTIKITKL